MQIFWHGLSCVRIESSAGPTEATLVTDPYDAESGLRFPRTLAPDIAVLSHQETKRFPLDQFTNKPFLINNPGEYEVKGMFVYGIPFPAEGGSYPSPVAYRFEVEGISIGFLGSWNRVPTESELGRLESIDVLMLPVGGAGKLTPKQAIEIVNAIEPRIVIPLDHHVEGLKEMHGTADAFCQEIGICKRQDGNKFKLTRKDLPAEDLLVAVLQRS